MRTNKLPALLLLPLASLLLAGCGSVVSDHRIPADSIQTRNYSSVAGDIDVGRRATVRELETVAGDIRIGEGARVGRIESVAGNVHLEPNVTVEGSIETVAGDIRIGSGCTVGGSIDSVAGDIRLEQSVVKGDVTLRHGSLDLVESRIEGALQVKQRKSEDEGLVRLTVGRGSWVREVIVDERRTDVQLRIHRGATVGPVKGVTAEYFD